MTQPAGSRASRIGTASPTADRCRYCQVVLAAAPASRPPWFAQVCDELACRARAQRAEMARVRDNRTQAREQQVSGDGVVAFVPVNQRVLGRASVRRRRAFLAHLERMIDEALEAGDVVEEDGRSPLLSPSLEPVEAPRSERTVDLRVVETACSACRGFCCTTTGTDAWITPSTIRRVREALPALDREALVARYRAQLPSRSYRDSCVYHAAGGCRLEGALRSDTCHRYVCDGLTKLVSLVRARGAAGVQVAAAVDSRVVRVSRLTADRPEDTPGAVAICPDAG